MNEELKKISQEKIKKVFFDNFRRTLTPAEIDEIFKNMVAQTTKELSKIPNIQQRDIDRYFETEKFEIVFSPRQVHKEISIILKNIGLQTLEESKKYKRLSEMNDAACLSLALKKAWGEEWVIKGQDNPDIILVKRSGKRFNEKPFYGINLEIMQVPQREKEKMNQEKIEQEIAQFIAKKKFLMRYGQYPHLLIHFNFTHKQLRLEEISKAIMKISGNPFHQIWIRATTDPAFSKMVLTQIYPDFLKVEFDFERDSHLYF
ncbi:MAG: hypothetical protein A3J76_01260 [Candidatus Moranbacteria bacterium RBG_13_45_13]|nr:MAG: hypothetical protein A3J76_01260 [Candidatus Moranbacteria bacterium RBG_13_45_13]